MNTTKSAKKPAVKKLDAAAASNPTNQIPTTKNAKRNRQAPAPQEIDVETRAMASIITALKPLQNDIRLRVLSYVGSRYNFGVSPAQQQQMGQSNGGLQYQGEQ